MDTARDYRLELEREQAFSDPPFSHSRWVCLTSAASVSHPAPSGDVAAVSLANSYQVAAASAASVNPGAEESRPECTMKGGTVA